MPGMMEPLPMRDVRVTDPFFSQRVRTAREIAIPYMWEALIDRIPGIPRSGCIANFRIAAGLEKGGHAGYVFQDSDLYKWLEGVAYSLATHPDEALERRADEAVGLIAAAQQPDGYLDTYYIIKGLDKRWTNLRSHHELYCAGHMMEAAAAYHAATGKDSLLRAACRFADHIDSMFGAGEGRLRGYPGHQEAELGLCALYRATGEERYLRLAEYFLLERGRQPYWFDIEAKARGEEKDGLESWFRKWGGEPYCYQQAHKPVLEQETATGHAVRVGYMLAGMADVAALAGNRELDAAAVRLYRDVTEKQMYVTGGVGSMGDGEAMTFDYDLPNDRMYTETCASIALLMTAQRLLRAHASAAYGDVAERALYNGILSGLSLDGTRYFYSNPLEMWPEQCLKRSDMRLDTERQGWYGCACCPPNLLRTLTGLSMYIYGLAGDTLYVCQYIASDASFSIGGRRISISQRGNYPWDGRMEFTVGGEGEFALALRVPGWCENAYLAVNGEAISLEGVMRDGFAVVRRVFSEGDAVTLTLDMPPRRVYCSDRVPFNAGRVSLARGPLVYCLEQEDNGAMLWNLRLTNGPVTARHVPGLLGGVTVLEATGLRERSPGGALLSSVPKAAGPCALTFVPYYAWCNRVPGEMVVWIRE